MIGFLQLGEFSSPILWQLVRDVRAYALQRGRELGAHPSQVGMALHGAAVALASPVVSSDGLHALMSSCLGSWLNLRGLGALEQRLGRPLGFGPYPEPE